MTQPLLEVKNLKVSFAGKKKTTNIVAGLSFNVEKGKTLCIVGESGCGKSMTSLSVMGLLPKTGEIEGEILLKGDNLTEKSMKQMSKIRGNQISMIFQEPMTSLNPVQTVGKQIAETIILHQKVSKKEARQKAVEMLQLVGIPSPDKRIDAYPHELSGGMRQRVMIAIALSCNPELLIADEPTTALDVTIQAQILDLMKNLQKDLDMGIIMITHDLAVVSEMADTVLVMYAGKAVEYGSRTSIFNNPLHPYTQGLMKCIPDVDAEEDVEELFVIKGSVPSPDAMPAGCRFADRCPYVQDICRAQSPDLEQVDSHHTVSCWKYTNLWEEGEKNGPAISEVAVGKSS
ncbi:MULTISPECIES: ABC transporter ATP-binding protein [unclassified Mesobacillus]|uniref:ABC transporter ATP-binding protein n=1 Tax=unclassified Mesobacillus TaxID=2675270 RepID=UPI0020414ABF|nr:MULTISPECIES: ABC transporter ATP-binding protein [unclassified Mesobacillus]MCM3125518.1 ABC transporter ATP-binding protein [Mesobacillus sp. MER 33]MCM3234438.1 ABC transporter ATP-binding protein [Mesobacillus sp. MER 48]